ncbi:hypothetical protein HCH_05572 [Hahella chejuensis KCTC 2396]|uniref:Uncharacterized protein n=1 Tax=Hahella chejuensis (strain KCTC 2396) TaxID=349521 RepID=Q2SAU2_HAHCH|nr:hypothetical protein HCH_05572 [Hahella chejuensis KCTC 2396]
MRAGADISPPQPHELKLNLFRFYPQKATWPFAIAFHEHIFISARRLFLNKLKHYQPIYLVEFYLNYTEAFLHILSRASYRLSFPKRKHHEHSLNNCN